MAAHWAGRGARMLTSGQDTALLGAAVRRTWAALETEGGIDGLRRAPDVGS
jgi:hypothetical protein